ncbi:metal ABC transporter solute-binding protein, Zn/Mn family [Sporosarcina sp. FSL K6-3457]|uniref:metal ABC transporter solute-binding protein, Zn/Mn family n=1 Tax=Sporosarcina sp. FSL K6-3457 TaxID=2978204 RepID=UPI0030F8013A
MNKKIIVIISLLTILLLAACGNKEVNIEQPTNNSGELAVYTTVYPLQYFTERIGGEHVDVKSIYPPGADEHTFDPTQKDMMALADSDLFFYIGLGLEGFVDNAEKTLKNEHVTMIATAEGISEEMLEEGHGHDEEGHEHEDESHDEAGHDHGPLDPHVWISPKLSVELATSIKNSLIEKAPDMAAEFEKNFEQLSADLVELDGKFKEMATDAPSKTFFVSHAAFSYIADPYGLEQVAIAGLNSQSEPSQKQLAALVEQAQELDVRYILFEQNVSSKPTEVIRKEIGAEALTLHNLGVLTVDDMEHNEDYFSLMVRNIETLRIALGGE